MELDRSLKLGFVFVVVLSNPTMGFAAKGGVALYEQQQYAQALESFEKKLKKDPENLYLQHNIASTYYELKDYAKALQQWQHVSQQAQDPLLKQRAHYARANAQFQLGQYKQAAQSYAAYLGKHPNDEQAKENLELSLKKLSEQKKQQQQQDQKSSPGDQKDDQQQASNDGEESEPEQKDQEQADASEEPDAQQNETKPQSAQPGEQQFSQQEASRMLDLVDEINPADVLKYSLQKNRKRMPPVERDW